MANIDDKKINFMAHNLCDNRGIDPEALTSTIHGVSNNFDLAKNEIKTMLEVFEVLQDATLDDDI